MNLQDWANRIRLYVLVTTCLISVAACTAAQEVPRQQVSNKKIIWFDGAKPLSALTEQDLVQGAKAFDGFVIQGMSGSQDNTKVGENFAWSVFSDRTYTLDPTDTSHDYIGDNLTTLKRLPANLMPERFIRINTTPYHPGAFDWLNDAYWSNVSHNMAIASQIASQAGLRGFFLDTEPYNPKLFNYNAWANDPSYQGMSYDQLAAIAERRGMQVMQALNSSMSSPYIIISFGYITVSQHVARSQVQKTGSLLASFLDGMLKASTLSTTFADGFEAGYWHNDSPIFFSNWRRAIADPKLYNVRFQKYPDRYLNQWQVGMGLFLDRDRDTHMQHNVYGWCGGAKDKLFYSPARLAFTVQQAARAADKYVWVYTQAPNIWQSQGQPGALPSVYIQAIRTGMQYANNPALGSLPASTEDIVKAAVCEQ